MDKSSISYPSFWQSVAQAFYRRLALLHGFTGELDATKANAATLVAQLQLETADKQQLSTKLADSESIKNELEAKVH